MGGAGGWKTRLMLGGKEGGRKGGSEGGVCGRKGGRERGKTVISSKTDSTRKKTQRGSNNPDKRHSLAGNIYNERKKEVCTT